MAHPLPDPADYLRAVVTDPDAAAAELERWSNPNHQAALRAVGAQQAIRAAYETPLTPAGVRSLTQRMRRTLNENVDSFVVASLLDLYFNVDSPAVLRRIEGIDRDVVERTMITLPSGIFSGAINPVSGADIEAWVAEGVRHFTEGIQGIADEYGSDYGEFYRRVCREPRKAKQDLDARTDLSDLHKRAKVYNAAFGALRMLFGNTAPTPEEHDQLLASMRQVHGDAVPATGLDNVIDGCYGGGHWPENEDRLSTALLLPSTMAAILDYTTMQILDFMRLCVWAEGQVTAPSDANDD